MAWSDAVSRFQGYFEVIEGWKMVVLVKAGDHTSCNYAVGYLINVASDGVRVAMLHIVVCLTIRNLRREIPHT